MHGFDDMISETLIWGPAMFVTRGARVAALVGEHGAPIAPAATTPSASEPQQTPLGASGAMGTGGCRAGAVVSGLPSGVQ